VPHRACKLVTVGLTIGGLRFSVEAEQQVTAALVARFGEFVDTPAGVVLHVDAAADFSSELERGETVDARPLGALGLTLGGPISAWFDGSERRGEVRTARSLGAVDALIRSALSVCLPLDGALPLHGALVGDAVLVGRSGAGKSTLAAALGGDCDEMVIVDQDGDAASTPYWHGRRARRRIARIVILERAGARTPSLTRVTGAAGLRELAAHLVRFVRLDAVDRAQLMVLGAIARRVPIVRAVCPEGAALVPWFASVLGEQSPSEAA
jgi:hypothetical protein